MPALVPSSAFNRQLNCQPSLLLKVGPGHYIFVKNPIVVYEERGDVTRVSIHVKPTAKQGVPEVSKNL